MPTGGISSTTPFHLRVLRILPVNPPGVAPAEDQSMAGTNCHSMACAIAVQVGPVVYQRLCPRSPPVSPQSPRSPRCDPKADDRRRRSMRVIGLVSRSRGRGQSVADSRAPGGTVYRDALPPSVVFFDDPVPGDRCGRCRSVYSHLIPIHKGDSLRRDCSGCGRYIENPVWYDPAAARDLLAGLKT